MIAVFWQLIFPDVIQLYIGMLRKKPKPNQKKGVKILSGQKELGKNSVGVQTSMSRSLVGILPGVYSSLEALLGSSLLQMSHGHCYCSNAAAKEGDKAVAMVLDGQEFCRSRNT